MALEGAYLYQSQKIHDTPEVYLNQGSGEPFAVVQLGNGSTYIRVHDAETAKAYADAFLQAMLLLDPDGPRERILAAVAGHARTGLGDDPDGGNTPESGPASLAGALKASLAGSRWRVIKTWLEAQLALIEAGLVDLPQVMLPFMIDDEGRTVYQRFLENEQIALTAGGPS